MPITIDKIEVNLDFHIFDILDFDLSIGYPLENFHHSPLGSLHEKLGEKTSASPCLENSLAKPSPKQNPLEEMHEQISSSTIEFEPFLPSPHGVVLNHNRDTTTIFHDESLEIENSWARESSEALTLEFEANNSGILLGESYSGIRALADFIRDITKYQQQRMNRFLGRSNL